jgi:hypothetical protein
MAIARDDRWLTDALGRALAGAQVFYCLQPATTTTVPPSPLATVYGGIGGAVLAEISAIEAQDVGVPPGLLVVEITVNFTSALPMLIGDQPYTFSGITGYTQLNGQTLSPVSVTGETAVFQVGHMFPTDWAIQPLTPDTGTASITQSNQLAQPLITDGFGHSIAYLDDSMLYTVMFVHPLFGPNPVVLTDQAISSGGPGGGFPTPVVPSGTPDGTLRSFGLPYAPSHPANGQLFNSGSYARYGVDYNISGATIVWIGITPPQEGDNLVYFGS